VYKLAWILAYPFGDSWKWMLHFVAHIWGEASENAIKLPFTLAIMYSNTTGATPSGDAAYARATPSGIESNDCELI
jgi:hypothetical protein